MHWSHPNKSEMESKNVEQVNDSACRYTGEKKIHLAVKVSETVRQRGKKWNAQRPLYMYNSVYHRDLNIATRRKDLGNTNRPREVSKKHQ